MVEPMTKPEPVFTPACCMLLVQLVAAGGGSIGLGIYMVSEKEWGAAFVLLLFGLLWFVVVAWVIGVRYRQVREYRNWIARTREKEIDDSQL
jgi:hypothetical protein